VIDAAIAFARVQNWTVVVRVVSLGSGYISNSARQGEGFVNNRPLEPGGDFHINAHP
jgi:hypothetical protein